MKNYTILNIPEDVLKDLKELGTLLFKEAEYKIQPVIDNGAIFRIIIRKGGENKCNNPVRNELFQSIMDRIPFADIITGVMMLNLKPNRFQRVHIDRDRHCAINVPIIIPENTELGVYKYELNDSIESKWFDMHPNDQNPGFNLEENGDTYHMKEPVLLNTKSWHWVWNKSNEARSVLSFDINKTPYLDTIDILKKNKWA
tara:strand:+ start:308 stop:907 length:600 start_codon:yes stop_codon:yes gene_type:complete